MIAEVHVNCYIGTMNDEEALRTIELAARNAREAQTDLSRFMLAEAIRQWGEIAGYLLCPVNPFSPSALDEWTR
jgi:hypothetical protein